MFAINRELSRYRWSFALLCFLFLVQPVSSQSIEKDSAAWRAAAKEREAAKAFLQGDGDPAAYERMLEAANETYQGEPDQNLSLPGTGDYLPRYRFEKGDVRGANKAAEDAIARYRAMDVVYGTQGPDGWGHDPSIIYINLVRLFRADANLYSGDYAVAKRDLQAILETEISKEEFEQKRTGWFGGWNVTTMEGVLHAAQYASFLNGDRDFVALIQDVFVARKSRGAEAGAIYLAILDKKFEQAINLAEASGKKFGFGRKANSQYLLSIAYAFQGDFTRSGDLTKILRKSRAAAEMIAMIDAVNALSAKKYPEAIEFATEAMKVVTATASRSGGYTLPGRQLLHSIRAEAYAAMERYENAKMEYESALLSSAEYQPAIDGLARIASLQSLSKKSDKEGPKITILEPASSRGLRITSATKGGVTIRGRAEDASGISRVQLDDQEIFFQNDGTFWGEVSSKSPQSAILVTAEDTAGNRSQISVAVEGEIASIPTSKEARAGQHYALVVAAQNYEDDRIPSLENPVPDAVRLKRLLINTYAFEESSVQTLFNPTLLDLKRALTQVRELIGPEDSLLIFYAGHGIWVEEEKKGYWLLTDAVRDDSRTWLANKAVLDMVAAIPSRNTLLITDACFSGSVFKTRGIVGQAPDVASELSSRISRVAITSGNDSVVPDESIFMKHLVKALSENNAAHLSAQKMFVNHIIEAVMTETDTEPRYGTLEAAGHVGGDYVFSKK